MDVKVLRLLDANFNRAREALRVLEDAARFLLDDAVLAGEAKGLRHELCGALAAVAAGELLARRDTPGDVGTVLTTEAEGRRGDALSVAVAAGRRLSEALRCLEEYAKLADGAMAGRIEAVRYRGYELEKRVVGRLERGRRFEGVRLYVLVTRACCRGGLIETVQGALAGGADAIQLREKGRADGELLGLAREVGALCRAAGAIFVMNDRADLAALAGADGLHVGQGDLPVAEARMVLPGQVAVGKSTHSVEEARAAAAEGPDYLAAGSIFGSGTKPEVARAGVELIRAVRGLWSGPLIAIGGVTAGNAREAVEAGATGVAVCEAVCSAANPAAAAAALKAAVSLGIKG